MHRQIFLKRVADEVHLVRGHGGIQGERQFMLAPVLALGGWAYAVLVGRKALDRRVVDGGLDAVFFHELDERGPVNAVGEENRHDMVGGGSGVVRKGTEGI